VGFKEIENSNSPGMEKANSIISKDKIEEMFEWLLAGTHRSLQEFRNKLFILKLGACVDAKILQKYLWKEKKVMRSERSRLS
jgi:hypothetical protein